MLRRPLRRHTRQPTSPVGFTVDVLRLVQFALLLGGSILAANAFVGEKGLVDALEARYAHRLLGEDVDRLRRDNEQLRRMAHRLRDDPRAVEEVARGELGLIAPGELLFIFSDQPHRPR